MVKKQSLVETVTEQLANMIQEEFSPGYRIPSEFELAERFNVSRSTVREAIKQLCTRNVLEIRRGDGTFVTDVPGLMNDPLGLSFVDSGQAMKDLAELAWIFQPPIAALAATRATESDIALLEEKHNAFMAALETLDEADEEQINHARQLESEFHDLIMQSCHNVAISRMSSVFSLLLQSAPVNKLAVIKISAKYHGRLLSAIKDGNSVLAEQTMMLHMSLNADEVN